MTKTWAQPEIVPQTNPLNISIASDMNEIIDYRLKILSSEYKLHITLLDNRFIVFGWGAMKIFGKTF
jgi:hypothetical protein